MIPDFLARVKSRLKSMTLRKRILLALGVFILPPLSLIILLFLLVWSGMLGELPSGEMLQKLDKPVASKLYASEGEYLGSYYTENRAFLDSTELNKYFVNALVSVEDHRFYSHSGVDYYSLGRVFFKTILLQDDVSGGGSTITQQLVKNHFQRKKYLIFSLPVNKFREMIIARRLESYYSKKQILWMYASTVSFGEQAFGLKTAAERFFNKQPSELLVEEAALLAGILKATSYYNPRKNPERALKRRNLVLEKMSEHGYLDSAAAINLSKAPLGLNYQAARYSNQPARYFKEYLVREFESISDSLRKPDGSKFDLYKDGLQIYTSLNLELQSEAIRLRNNYLNKLQNLFEDSWKGRPVFGPANKNLDKEILKHPEYIRWRSKGLSSEEALDSFNVEQEYSLWDWEESKSLKTTRIDSIKHYLKLLHNAVFAIHPANGEIKLYIGGNDFSYFQYDNIQARRQVGSLFKPFVYLAALEKGVAPCDYYKNELTSYPAYNDWSPENANGDYGGYMAVFHALSHSVNTIAVQMIFEAGIDRVVDLAKSLGIESRLEAVPSIVLGTSDISLFEMAKAYATIMNLGVRPEVHGIKRIEDRYGNTLYEFSNDELKRIPVDEKHLYDLRSMLEKTTMEGTGRRLFSNYSIPVRLASKTGTTQDQTDGWFIASSEDLLIGAWTGFQNRAMHFPDLASGSASRTALPVVGMIFQRAAEIGDLPLNSFEVDSYDCPGSLSEEAFELYQEDLRIDSLMAEGNGLGGWLKKIFGADRPKKSLNEKYNEQQIRKQIKKLQEERQLQIEQYNAEIRRLQTQLENLNENIIE